MKIATHPWNPSGGATDKLKTINTGVVTEIEVPAGKHVAQAVESVIYNEYDGTYSMHDNDFMLEGVKHEQYPLAGECKKLHGSHKGGLQTTAWFLIVADEPFSVKCCNMAQDEKWGTFDAEIDRYYKDSVPIAEFVQA